MPAILTGNKLYLSGLVGSDWFEDETFSSVDVLMALEQLGPAERATVYINSPGGHANAGVAIYSMLASHPGGVDVVIEGMAASAGSLIAMAGETITMSLGSVMMIHDPAGFTHGNSEAHSKSIEALEAVATSFADIYARKSGKTPAECRKIMKAETWYTPEEAIAAGFADEKAEPARAVMVAAFDYSKFLHAPQQLVALAREKNWIASSNPAPTPQPRKDRKMPKDNNAHAAATARIKTIMKADEAQGRSGLAEHLAYETDLEPQAAIAIMGAAPQGHEEHNAADNWRPMHMRGRADGTANAAGLNGSHRSGKGPSRLVTAMKQRHQAN